MSGLSTKSSSNVSDKKTKIANLKEKHGPLFEAEGVDYAKAKFIPKMAYMPSSGKERVIALFPSEISGGQDVYTEFVSKDYDPEDSERRLWKWPYNPHYKDEYESTEPHPVSGHVRYLIPVEELINVAEEHSGRSVQPEQTSTKFDDLPDPDEDQPIGELTIRDKAAIDWKKPVSKKKWLNDLIIANFGKDE